MAKYVDLNALEQKVHSMDGIVEGLRQYASRLGEEAPYNREMAEEHRRELDRQSKILDELDDEGMKAHDRLDNHENRLGNLQIAVNDHAQRIDEQGASLPLAERALSMVEEMQARYDATLAALSATANSLRKRVEELENSPAEQHTHHHYASSPWSVPFTFSNPQYTYHGQQVPSPEQSP